MARPCTICTSPRLDDVNAELAGGASCAVVGERYGLGQDSVRRHKHGHLTPALVAVSLQRRGDTSAATVLNRLEALFVRIEAFLDVAEHKGSLVGGAAVFREARQTLETIAKITGELDERPVSTTVNVLTSDSWQQVRGRLSAALAPFPDARAAVAAALAELGPAS